MKKKIAVLVTAVALVALVAIGATFALFTDSHSTLNTVTMGNVKITLTEPQFSEDTDNTNTIANVVPRQVIDKDPTIENVGKNDAYVRVLLAYEGLTETQSQEVEALLDIDGENWIKGEDGYYYYQNILAAGADPIVLFTKLTVPDWGTRSMIRSSRSTSRPKLSSRIILIPPKRMVPSSAGATSSLNKPVSEPGLLHALGAMLQ